MSPIPTMPITSRCSDNFRWLKKSTDQSGKSLKVVKLPMPKPVLFEGQRLPASYANFYIANKLVLVPVFGDPNDRVALNTSGRSISRARDRRHLLPRFHLGTGRAALHDAAATGVVTYLSALRFFIISVTMKYPPAADAGIEKAIAEDDRYRQPAPGPVRIRRRADRRIDKMKGGQNEQTKARSGIAESRREMTP